MESDSAALRISALISISTMTVCLTCRSQSKMPMIASVLSAWMKILSIKASCPQFPMRARADDAAVVQAGGQSHTSCQRDHCPIVRTELGARKIQFRGGSQHDLSQPLTQSAICADPARDHETPMAG